MHGPRPPVRTQLLRRASLVVHRYVGLAMAGFLIVAGLSGSMMAFYPQLDALLNPSQLTVAPPADGRAPLDPFVLRERLIAQLSAEDAREVHGVILRTETGRATNYWVDGREVFVDPYSGRVLGSRKFGALSEGRKGFLTFLYQLHFSLALGEVGEFLFGCVALLWTLDCFVGAYLTFPRPLRSGERDAERSWLARWWPAWLLKTSKLFSLIFSWHRASGLWLWLVLLVFAWSAVALNLRDVYEPVMSGVFGSAPRHWEDQAALPVPRAKPRISLREAHQRARQLMAAEAARRGFQVLGENYLDYDAEHGVYAYTVESSLDISERLADTNLAFDGDTGELTIFSAPTGQHAGRTVTAWLIALHFGAVRSAGLAYRAFVCALGLLVALLSVSGVWIWWKKRGGRARAAPRGESA